MVWKIEHCDGTLVVVFYLRFETDKANCRIVYKILMSIQWSKIG